VADARQHLPELPNGRGNAARYVFVPIANLHYDPQNPRLGGAAKRKNQDQIQKYLEGQPHYALDLVGSIVTNGFLPYEPLIVRQEADKYVVIEGNRRLAAVRSILSAPADKYEADVIDGLQRIPVLVFAEDANQRDSESVLRYLGVKHLFGFRDWPPTQ
jgi:ParB-like chromosome segregation protein Spo0J